MTPQADPVGCRNILLVRRYCRRLSRTESIHPHIVRSTRRETFGSQTPGSTMPWSTSEDQPNRISKLHRVSTTHLVSRLINPAFYMLRMESQVDSKVSR